MLMLRLNDCFIFCSNEIIEPDLLAIPVKTFMEYDHFYLFDLVANQPPYLRHYHLAPYETSIKLTSRLQCYDYKGISSHFFGKKFIAGSITVPPIDQQFGCQPFNKSKSFSGLTVVFYRGECNFDIKVQNAHNAGAQAVVILRDDDDPPFRPYVSSVNDKIPCILLDRFDSKELLAVLKANSGTSTVSIKPLPPLPGELDVRFLGKKVHNMVMIN
ncbi:hypothetical protein BDF20DRAFT_901281, partial [Mycotypha africana]|uniref:uncharacterized protein n=1 Tax=Mycotypha africana TaxID=64632 RepID=UPI0023007604